MEHTTMQLQKTTGTYFTGLLAGLAMLAVTGCSEDARDWSGDYEALFGEGCGLMLESSGLDFSIVPTAGEGDSRSYTLRLNPSLAANLGFPMNSTPAVEDDNGRLIFNYDITEQGGWGTESRRSMSIRLAPHPDKEDMALIYQWRVSSSTNVGFGADIDGLDAFAQNGLPINGRYNDAPALCIGKVDRLDPKERQKIMAKLQKAEDEIRIKREAEEAKARAEAEAARQAEIDVVRAMDFDEYYSLLGPCRDYAYAQRDSVTCQAARGMRDDRLSEQKQTYITQYGEYEDDALEKFLKDCRKRGRDELTQLACQAALEVSKERTAAAREAEKQRLLALSFDDYAAEYDACNGARTLTCEVAKKMKNERAEAEAKHLLATVSGAELYERRETICKGSSAPRTLCHALQIAKKEAWKIELDRLANSPEDLEQAHNDCTDRMIALAKTKNYATEASSLMDSFQCKTSKEALAKLGIRVNYRKHITLTESE
ncbi:MAG: hypothetical protein ACK5ME_09965 [Parahaliea sp.]